MSRTPKIHKWLYSGELSGRFLMLPPELFEDPAFQKLSFTARYFYVALCLNKETECQRACLYKSLEEYNRIFDLGLTEQDIRDEATPNKRTKNQSGLFVAPVKQMEQYGFKKNYQTKLKKELIQHGFIKVKYGGKGRYGGWNENVTVYQFSNEWKK